MMDAKIIESLNFGALEGAPSGDALLSKEEEWLKQRWGKFTASEIHRLMASPSKDELSKGGITYAQEKAVEVLTEFSPDFFISYDMQWGVDHELDAVDRFSAESGVTVEFTGEDQRFMLSEDGSWGGTPDGVIFDMPDTGLEVKCPKSRTHLIYMDITDAMSMKDVKPDYYWQCQSLIELHKADFWYFASYDPRFMNEQHQIHIAKIERVQSDIDFMLRRVELATELKERIISNLA